MFWMSSLMERLKEMVRRHTVMVWSNLEPKAECHPECHPKCQNLLYSHLFALWQMTDEWLTNSKKFYIKYSRFP